MNTFRPFVGRIGSLTGGFTTTPTTLHIPKTYTQIPIPMLRRYALGFSANARPPNMSSTTPIEDTIRAKVTAALSPSTLEIYNDSHLHSHHKAMQGQTSKETHFRLVIVSDAFGTKMQSARHRMIYALLREEMSGEGGIHALQLKTLTPEEEEKQREAKAAKAAAKQAEAEAQSSDDST
ncbi:BolA-like protein 1 [Colletotrichum fructicola]|uniref:BolA-like protein n=4 Tax=Colletotrichum gloeosporioides species complex TaxID=2707338 RepID=A0A9W4RS57_9PEZI|nr:BolA-like protein 1 [Colletotrichum fructicola]KAF4909332.1 BolA-like protein 1 [Colletotrichum fructicola]KAF4935852.1 BolA-like protein 1 [Colletotrichum fructicola]KAK1846210.1 BolA domain-containing protein [Colletotrichum chrysophilum]CAI0645937.1 unnamed protein product [Colletotrichum noveboracense]